MSPFMAGRSVADRVSNGTRLRQILGPPETTGPNVVGPLCLFVELEDPHRVLSEKLGPNVVSEGNVGHLVECALEADSHRVVPGIHDLVGAPGVGIVDDGLGG